MGCAPSTLAVAELNRSLATEHGSQRLLGKLQSSPGLLSTSASVLASTVGTPLHAACEKRQVLAVQEILSFLICSPLPLVREALQPYCRRLGRQLPATVDEGLRVAVDMINCKGQTPLMLACASGSPQLVRLLLAQGADPWVGDHCGGRAALHYAAIAGHADCIQALMNNLRVHQETREGVSYVNVRTERGLSALHYAVFYGMTAAVEELLRHDPSLNVASNSHGEDVLTCCDALSTPLHFAAYRGNIEVARLMLKHYLINTPAWGASRSQDPRMRANYGNMLPWQVAAANHPGKRELVALLHPGEPLERALGLPLGLSRDGRLAVPPGRRGPLPLANLAAAALQSKLLADLKAAAKGPPPPQQQQQQQQAAAAGQQQGKLQGQGALSGGRDTGVGRPGPVAAMTAWPAVSGNVMRREQSGSITSSSSSSAATDGWLRAESGLGVVGCGAKPGAKSAAHVEQQEENDDDEELCGVCFSNKQEVAAAGCRHAVCRVCAEEMVRGMLSVGRPRPLPCAFCRREVAGFVRVAACSSS